MTAGDQVDFAAKLRDPEVMNDIGGFEAELHIGSGGNVNLVGRRKAQFWIAHLPPPLVSDDDDVIAAGLRRWVGGVHNVERKPEDHRQQKCGRNDIRKLPRCAAEDLLGIGRLAARETSSRHTPPGRPPTERSRARSKASTRTARRLSARSGTADSVPECRALGTVVTPQVWHT